MDYIRKTINLYIKVWVIFGTRRTERVQISKYGEGSGKFGQTLPPTPWGLANGRKNGQKLPLTP